MFEFVSKALLTLVLDKRAREALEAADSAAEVNPAKSATPAAPAPAKSSASAPPRGREPTA
ncbi:MAG: hypothetical protein AAB223_02150, partial [Pseudomonadota bacterium]